MLQIANKDYLRARRFRYVIREGFLDEEKRKALHRMIPADSPAETMAAVEAGIGRGEFSLMDILEDGEKIGFTVFCVCQVDSGKEMLSIATYAKGRGDVTTEAMPLLERIAEDQGCRSIRLHTMRTGLVEKLKNKLGWFVSEIVMRKEF